MARRSNVPEGGSLASLWKGDLEHGEGEVQPSLSEGVQHTTPNVKHRETTPMRVRLLKSALFPTPKGKGGAVQWVREANEGKGRTFTWRERVKGSNHLERVSFHGKRELTKKKRRRKRALKK